MTRGKSKRARDRYRITYLLGVHVPRSTHYKHAEGKKKKSDIQKRPSGHETNKSAFGTSYSHACNQPPKTTVGRDWTRVSRVGFTHPTYAT